MSPVVSAPVVRVAIVACRGFRRCPASYRRGRNVQDFNLLLFFKNPVNHPIDMWFLPVKQVSELVGLRRDWTTGRVMFET